MKRSSCLRAPALLLGLTITSALVAREAAAAPEGTRRAGVRIAQAQPSDPPPEEGQTTPAPPPTTAPALGDGTTEAQPAVSIGTTTTSPTPATDQPSSSAEPAAKKPKPRPW